VEKATSNEFEAGLVFTPGGNDRVNSLQDEDELTGEGTNPILNVTIGNANDASSFVITPTLNGIETINAAFSNSDGTALDLQDADGLKNVNVSRVSVGGAQIFNMQNSVSELSVTNTQARPILALTYINEGLSGNADVVNVALSRVNANTFSLGSDDGLFAVASQQIETVNMTINAPSSIQVLDLFSDGITATGQTLNITANANFSLGVDLDGDGNLIEENNGLITPSGVNRIGVSGAGNVTLASAGSMLGFALAGGTATGAVLANISNADGDETASFTTGAGADQILSDGLLGDVVTNSGNDTVTVNGSVEVNLLTEVNHASGSISTGEGNDTVLISGSLQGNIRGGALVNLGAGNDTLQLGDDADVSVGEEAVINAGEGNDSVTLSGSIVGDTAGVADADTLSGEINMGAGDDTVTFNLLGQGNQTNSLVQGLLTGGSGNNTLSVSGNANATLVASDASNTDRVTDFGTLNLISEQSVSAVMDVAINAVRVGTTAQNDDNDQTADYTVDVSEFTGLTNIGIRNEAGIIDATANEALAVRKFAGDAASYNLNKLQGGETINVKTVEAGTNITGEARTTGGIDGRVRGSTELSTNSAADATLNLSLALGATNNTASVTIDPIAMSGQTDGDVAINDVGVWTPIPTVADTHTEIANLTLAINGSTNRTIALVAGDFRNTLNLTSNAAAGRTHTLTGVEATTINAQSVAASLSITTVSDEGKRIYTGSGSDQVDLRSDTVNGANSLALADRDIIDLGAGANRIIVDTSLRGAGADADEVFDNISNVQTVQMHGTLNLTLDDDASRAGVTTVEVRTAASNIDLDIGPDFERALTLDMAGGTLLNVDNDGDVDLTINMATSSSADTVLTLADGGTGQVALNVTVANATQVISDTATGANNDIVILNLDPTSEVNTIRLRDSSQTSTATGAAAATASGVITLTLDADWAQASDTMVIDASNINDDSLDANGDGDFTDTGSDVNDGVFLDEPADIIAGAASSFVASRGDIGYARDAAGNPEVGNDILDTQSLVIDASAANYSVNITSSQVVDTITGTNRADSIDGQAGNDRIIGALGGDMLTGGAGNDTLQYGVTALSNPNPVLAVSSTARSAQLDSNQVDGPDTVSDFATGSDKLEIHISSGGNIVNLARFASVTSLGNGDASLEGTNTVRVVGDAFYSSSGQLVIDVNGDGDVTSEDLYIASANAIAAGDINHVVSGVAGNDVMRGGQGIDQLWGNAGDDVFVVLGSLTTADVNAYAAAGSAAAVGILSSVASVLTYNELLSTRTSTEVQAGDIYHGGVGADNDVLHVFGTTDLSLATLISIDTLAVHSSVTLKLSEINTINDGAIVGGDDLARIILSGNTAHNITIVDDVTTPGSLLSMTDAAQKTAFETWVAQANQQVFLTGAGANTSLTVGGVTYTGDAAIVTYIDGITGANEGDPTDTSSLAPVSSVTNASYDAGNNVLTFTVSNYDPNLTYDFTGKLSYDFDGTGASALTPTLLTASYIAAVNHDGVGVFQVSLTNAAASLIEGNAAYGANSGLDSLVVGAGYVTNNLGISGGTPGNIKLSGSGGGVGGSFDLTASNQSFDLSGGSFTVMFSGTNATALSGNLIVAFKSGTGSGHDTLDLPGGTLVGSGTANNLVTGGTDITTTGTNTNIYKVITADGTLAGEVFNAAQAGIEITVGNESSAYVIAASANNETLMNIYRVFDSASGGTVTAAINLIGTVELHEGGNFGNIGTLNII